MREYSRYHFIENMGTGKCETALTICYEFDTKEECYNSELLNDKRRTSAFMCGGKYYICGHFAD